MECPFELPVKREFTHVNEAGVKYKVVSGERALAAYLTKDEADYIVQAINCHDKHKAGINRALERYNKADEQIDGGFVRGSVAWAMADDLGQALNLRAIEGE